MCVVVIIFLSLSLSHSRWDSIQKADSGIETITEKDRDVFIINVGQWFIAEGSQSHTRLLN